MSVSGVAAVMRATANTLWRMLSHYVEKAVGADYTEIRKVGADECARKKGHSYITTFCDLVKHRVVHVVQVSGKDTVRKSGAFLDRRGIARDQVTDVCADMWDPYRMSVEEHFSKAALTFDRHHVMTLFNRAIDLVRPPPRSSLQPASEAER